MPPTKPSAHGWRLTWPMVLADLVAVAALVPDVLPVLPASTPAWVRPALTIFALLVARLNHSPLPTTGGGLPRPPTATLLVLLIAGLSLASSACGSSWQGHARETLGLASRAAVFADRVVTTQAAAQCPDHAADCVHAHHLDVAYDSVAAAKSAIAAGEAALLHALDTGVENLWSTVAPCLGASLAAMLRAVTDAGVGVPAWVNDAAALVIAILGPCPAASTS